MEHKGCMPLFCDAEDLPYFVIALKLPYSILILFTAAALWRTMWLLPPNNDSSRLMCAYTSV